MRFRLSAGGLADGTSIDGCDAGTWRPARRIDGIEASRREIVVPPGTFISDELQATLRFDVEAGRLVMRTRGAHGIATCLAEPFGRDLIRFWSHRWPGGMLARLVRHEGEIVGIVIATSRTPATTFLRRGVSATA